MNRRDAYPPDLTDLALERWSDVERASIRACFMTVLFSTARAFHWPYSGFMTHQHAKAVYSTLWVLTVAILGVIAQPASAMGVIGLLFLAVAPPLAVMQWMGNRAETMSQLIAKGRR